MKELISRWFTSEGLNLYGFIIETFSKNLDVSKVKGISKHNERLDLRGITFPLQNPKSPQLPFVLNAFNLENVDLSYATLYQSVWKKCALRNVVFYRTKADDIKFWACRLDQVVFENTYLNDALMNATLGNDAGSFNEVNFIDSNLKGSMYVNTLFEKCNFLQCKLDNVDFNGSRFQDCKFEGSLNEVFFRGSPLINRKLYPNAKPLANRMMNVDFSQARLQSVMFLDEIDLSSCLFPSSDDYLIIRENRRKIFEEARNEIELNWEGLNKKIALTLINQSYLSARKINNKIEVVDKHYLLDNDKQFGTKFFDLLKRLNEKLND